MRTKTRLLSVVAVVEMILVAFLVGGITPASSAVISTPQHYTVEAGETYASIAAKMGVSASSLACANRTNATTCPSTSAHPGTGRIIHVPDALPVTTTTVEATTPTTMEATTSAPPAGTLFSESFDTPDKLFSRLKFQITPAGPFTSGLSFNGDHAAPPAGSATCGGADTTRPLYEDHLVSTHVYWCNGHYMTAINTGGYVTIAETPRDANGPIIFPASASQFCFDRSEQDTGGRKWFEVSVISSTHFAANGGTLVYQNPVFNDNLTGNAVRMSGDDFQFRDLGGNVQYFVGQEGKFASFFVGYADSSDKMTRYQTCVKDNGNGTVTRTQDRAEGTTVVTGPGAFPAGPKVFIFADVTYDADKEQVPGERVANPYTWHWDNLSVS